MTESDPSKTSHESPGRPSVGDPSVPERIGPFRVVGLLGEGGMGTVYRAEQEGAIRRTVALKLIRPGRSPDSLRRFEAERQALALMQHPNIAQVFEAGWQGERPYFAMELVDGSRITSFCDRRRLGIRARLELFMTVCHAVQHAHQKGVIHRDLKPSNILVTEEDGRPVPKIIDFGIAKALEGRRLADQTLDTGNRLLGTPGYLSPEALLSPGEQGSDVDTRSDIYSLGVVLYQLLLGVLPFGTTKDSFVKVIGRLTAGDPPSLSRRAAELDARTLGEQARLRGTEARALSKAVRGELEWIAGKAIARQRSERYVSAAELANDIGRHLRHEPILAGPPSTAYRAAKMVRRHAVAVAMASLLLLVLAGGLIARTLEARRANREAARANREAVAAQQVSDFLIELFAATDPWQAAGALEQIAGETPVRVILERGAERIDRELEDQPLVRARLMKVMSMVYRQLDDPEGARSLAERSLELRRQHLPAKHPDIGESLHALAWVEDMVFDPAAAEALFRQALEIRRHSLGDEHTEVAASLNGLGWSLRAQGQYDAAEPYFRQALDIRRRQLGEQHEDVAESLDELGWNLKLRGRYAEAEKLFRESLAIRLARYGEHHATVARSRRDLGTVLVNHGKLSEAEAELRQALTTLTRIFGEPHPLVASVLQDLASCFTSQGENAAAEQYFRRALANLDEADPQRTAILNNLGLLLLATGRNDDAVTLLRQVLRLHREQNEDHPLVAVASGNLGLALHAVGEMEQAESMFRDTLARYSRQLDPAHPSYGIAHHNLARLLVDTGELEAAEPLARQAVAILGLAFPAEHYPGGHWRTANAESVLGAYLARTGRFEEAEALLLPAAEIVARARGEASWYTRDARRRVTELYEAWDQGTSETRRTAPERSVKEVMTGDPEAAEPPEPSNDRFR